jgi:hypothetical protein
MLGYVSRADRMLDDPWTPHEYSGFFPFGTHAMLAVLKLLLGKENYTGIGLVYALLGAATVAMAYATARRASRFRWLPPAVGLIGVFYYPHISLGGYLLSEVPFAFLLGAAVLSCLRMVDEGRRRDAFLMGLWCGLGALIRPQMLLSAALVGLYWIARRKAMPHVRFAHLAWAGLPVALCLAFGAVHLHHHTGRWGLVSENGSFNLVFARCHNIKIESQPDGKGRGRVHFKPPPFLQIRNLERKAAETGEEPAMRLDGALGEDIEYEGYIGDAEIHHRFIRECWARTGWVGQLGYTWTNVRLLWLHNIAWPDSGRPPWRPYAQWWSDFHRTWLALPALLGLLWIFVPRRRGGARAINMGLVAVNLLALVVLAAIYFGGARHRSPYDFVILVLAAETYAMAAVYGLPRLLRWLVAEDEPPASQTSSSGK